MPPSAPPAPVEPARSPGRKRQPASEARSICSSVSRPLATISRPSRRPRLTTTSITAGPAVCSSGVSPMPGPASACRPAAGAGATATPGPPESRRGPRDTQLAQAREGRHDGRHVGGDPILGHLDERAVPGGSPCRCSVAPTRSAKRSAASVARRHLTDSQKSLPPAVQAARCLQAASRNPLVQLDGDADRAGDRQQLGRHDRCPASVPASAAAPRPGRLSLPQADHRLEDQIQLAAIGCPSSFALPGPSGGAAGPRRRCRTTPTRSRPSWRERLRARSACRSTSSESAPRRARPARRWCATPQWSPAAGTAPSAPSRSGSPGRNASTARRPSAPRNSSPPSRARHVVVAQQAGGSAGPPRSAPRPPISRPRLSLISASPCRSITSRVPGCPGRRGTRAGHASAPAGSTSRSAGRVGKPMQRAFQVPALADVAQRAPTSAATSGTARWSDTVARCRARCRGRPAAAR